MSHLATPESDGLSFFQKVRLRDAFLRLPGIADETKRDAYVHELSLEFPGVHHAARHPDPEHDVFGILVSCVGYPGALRRLWTIVKSFHAQDDLSAELDELVETADPTLLLLATEREPLLEVLSRVDVADVLAAYRYAMRTRQEGWLADPPDLRLVVHRVESLAGAPGQLHAIFPFVDYIAHCARSTEGGHLHAWIDGTALRLGFADRMAIDQVCQATKARLTVTRCYYFAAKIVSDKMAPDHYFLTTWRQHADEPEEPTYEAEESAPLPEVTRQLHKLMRQLPREVDERVEEMVLELVLPRSLITIPVDQWQVDDVLPYEIGTEYPLVLRSLERLENADLHVRWGVKWQWLKDHDRSVGTDSVTVIRSHDWDAVRALRGALVGGEPPAAVMMLVPVPDSPRLTADAFTAGLYGGAPVMIWCRAEEFADEFHSQLLTAIADHGVLRLPYNVFQLRLQTLGYPSDADHVGRHVALAYEDADRIPEQFRPRARLSPPQRREASLE